LRRRRGVHHQQGGAPMSASGIRDWYSASMPRQHRAENATEQSPPDTRRSSDPGARVQPGRAVQLNHLSVAVFLAGHSAEYLALPFVITLPSAGDDA